MVFEKERCAMKAKTKLAIMLANANRDASLVELKMALKVFASEARSATAALSKLHTQ